MLPLLLREITVSTSTSSGGPQGQGAVRAAVSLCLPKILEVSRLAIVLTGNHTVFVKISFIRCMKSPGYYGKVAQQYPRFSCNTRFFGIVPRTRDVPAALLLGVFSARPIGVPDGGA